MMSKLSNGYHVQRPGIVGVTSPCTSNRFSPQTQRFLRPGGNLHFTVWDLVIAVCVVPFPLGELVWISGETVEDQHDAMLLPHRIRSDAYEHFHIRSSLLLGVTVKWSNDARGYGFISRRVLLNLVEPVLRTVQFGPAEPSFPGYALFIEADEKSRRGAVLVS